MQDPTVKEKFSRNPASCCQQRKVGQYGDHTAVCPRFVVSSSRGNPVERAAARVYRRAGATVACNVLVNDLNPNPAKQDERQIEVIEVIVNGLVMGGVCTLLSASPWSLPSLLREPQTALPDAQQGLPRSKPAEPRGGGFTLNLPGFPCSPRNPRPRSRRPLKFRSRQFHPPPCQDPCQERLCLLTRSQHFRAHATMVCPFHLPLCSLSPPASWVSLSLVQPRLEDNPAYLAHWNPEQNITCLGHVNHFVCQRRSGICAWTPALKQAI